MEPQIRCEDGTWDSSDIKHYLTINIIFRKKLSYLYFETLMYFTSLLLNWRADLTGTNCDLKKSDGLQLGERSLSSETQTGD